MSLKQVAWEGSLRRLWLFLIGGSLTVLALSGCGSSNRQSAVVTHSSSASGTSSTLPMWTPHAVTAQEVANMYSTPGGAMKSVTKVAVKEMTWSEFWAGAGSDTSLAGLPAGAVGPNEVYIVAQSGVVNDPSVGQPATPYTYQWRVAAVDPATGFEMFAMFAPNGTSGPSFYSNLPGTTTTAS